MAQLTCEHLWLGYEGRPVLEDLSFSVQAGDCTMTGQQLRQALGLRSTHFSVIPLPDGFSFSVLGYGHGVGLSQNGADYLARQGSDFQQILLHYYTGVDLFSVR